MAVLQRSLLCLTPCLKHIQQIMLVMLSNAVATMDLQPSYESSCDQTAKLTMTRIVTTKTHQRSYTTNELQHTCGGIGLLVYVTQPSVEFAVNFYA